MAKSKARNPVPTWGGIDYPRVAPGRYQAVAVRTQGPEWTFAFRRWSLLLEFELLAESEGPRVCAFFNMGSHREGPKVGSRSRYFQAWTLANGELPRRGQRMDPDVFLEGQIYLVEVDDSRTNSEEQAKADSEIYSRVTRILSVERRPGPIMNHESKNQESEIMQSPNQAINQSRLAVGQPLRMTHEVSSLPGRRSMQTEKQT